MSIKDELLLIKGNKEVLTTDEVLRWAKAHPNSDLHHAIEWDDAKAADDYRHWQVRRLMAIHITYESGERRFVSLSIDRKDGGGYRDVEQVIASQSLHAIMLNDALRELERVQKKYTFLTELKPVWREIDRVRSKGAKPKKKGRTRAA